MVLTSNKPMNQLQENEQILVELREIKKHLKNTSQPLPLSEWIDSYDVCKMLKISRRLLDQYRSSGLLFSKIGGKIFFHTKNIEKFLLRHQSKKAS